ncbi:MAG: hypothetical protein Q4G52_05185 [Clostridia bacterium]|nr:hypothetical protein [Clostridia bacterium]
MLMTFLGFLPEINPSVLMSAIADESNDITLSVSGGSSVGSIDQIFASQGIKIDTNSMYYDAVDVQRILLAQIETPDVFVLDADDGYWGLVQKGYLEEITDHEILREISSYYPFIQLVLKDSRQRVVSIPEYFYATHWCVNETLWMEILGDTPYPSTYLELAKLYKQWRTDFAEEHSSVKLLEFSGDSCAFILSVIKQYLAECQISGSTIEFDHPMFIDTLETLRELDLKAISIDDEDIYFNQHSLLIMRPFGGFGVEYLDGFKYVPISPPCVTQEGQPYIPARMRVMLINPFSPHKDAAYQYMKAYMNAYSSAFKASIISSWNTPVYSAQAKREIQQIQETIELKTQLLQKAQEEWDVDTEDKITFELLSLREKLDTVAQEGYEVSEEDILAYQSIAPYINLLFGSPYASDDDPAMQSISRVVKQFVDQKITSKECALALNEITRMVSLENGV